MKPPPTKSMNAKILQIAYVVDNLDAVMRGWTETIGAGPFFAQKNMHVETEYRGQPSWIDVSAAFGQGGAVQVELIEVHGDNPSVYRDMYSRGQFGCHHVALFVDDLAEQLRVNRLVGHEVGMRGSFAGTPYAYVDTRSSTGIFTELFQNTAGINLLYKRIADAAADWDGRDPVRPMADLFT